MRKRFRVVWVKMALAPFLGIGVQAIIAVSVSSAKPASLKINYCRALVGRALMIGPNKFK